MTAIPTDCRVTVTPRTLICTTPGGLETATLRVSVSAPSPCRGIRITLPTGEAPDDLTPTTAGLITSTPGWDLDTSTPGTLFARREPHTDGTAVDLDLAGLLVSAQPGPVSFTVAATLDDGTEHTTTHQLVKQSNNFAIDRFAPAKAQVGYGSSVTLSWQGPKSKPAYYLWRSDGKTPSDPKIEPQDNNGQCSFEVKDLTDAATAFLLKAAGAQNKEARAVTAVAVAGGDVRAGKLSVNGRTTLMKTPNTFLDTTTAVTKTYTSSTDGFLTASVTSTQHGARATLTITVSPSGSQSQSAVVRTLNADAANVPVNIQLPVPADATLELKLTGNNPSAQATWFPLGGGALTEKK
ncbi:hypothetical protein [Streptomyces sp. UNOB3_S3]|uniref:hypothetical protein n=1 Tax=Streptomyces sp. UNOB3_S3 TaxID=2871682 RepID=UPI001E5CAEB1|nr:hypothetical protein [Streptomyces sp. UNOB3_S3]MCC3776641.1 hypothetical protein [Streptomyces sp. UNOB3_S3]